MREKCHHRPLSFQAMSPTGSRALALPSGWHRDFVRPIRVSIGAPAVQSEDRGA
jgi:hypothetical protein